MDGESEAGHYMNRLECSVLWTDDGTFSGKRRFPDRAHLARSIWIPERRTHPAAQTTGQPDS